MFTCCSSQRPGLSNGIRIVKITHSPLNMFRRHHQKPVKSNSRYSVHRLKHDLRRTLWHAFDSLSNPSGNVHRSQLKVLASSIGRALGVEKCEEYLDNNEATDLDFSSFYTILDEQLLEPLSKAPVETIQLGHSDFEEVHRVCWTLCSNKRISRRMPDLEKPLPDDVLYKLWRMFNFLADVDDVYIPILPLRMDREEVQQIVKSFIAASGQLEMDSVVDSIGKDHQCYSYIQFQALFEMDITKNLSDKVLHHAINTVYDDYINDTMMRGMVFKRGHQVKSWKERWMVLNAGELRYFTSQDQRDCKGFITFDNDCTVEVLSEQVGHKPNRFVLHTTAKPYEMSASDISTRNEWISALRRVIEHCDDDSYHFHQNDFIQRREQRELRRKQKEKEEKHKQEEAENLRRMQHEFDDKHKQDAQRLEEKLRELETERKEKEALEAKLREEEALRELDQQRLRELEAMKNELERLLDEERQAKKDEEIVRSLQARILEEETQKREELERLKEQHEELLKMEKEKREGLEGQKEQQEELLKMERQKREGLEGQKKHQEELLEMERQKREGLEGQKEQQEELLKLERQKREGLEGLKEQQQALLQDAEERLKQLEVERMKADGKLQEAHNKLQEAEKERIKLEDKVKLWKKPNIGLARPIQPKVSQRVTHRGRGAFCDEDFRKHQVNDNDHRQGLTNTTDSKEVENENSDVIRNKRQGDIEISNTSTANSDSITVNKLDSVDKLSEISNNETEVPSSENGDKNTNINIDIPQTSGNKGTGSEQALISTSEQLCDQLNGNDIYEIQEVQVETSEKNSEAEQSNKNKLESVDVGDTSMSEPEPTTATTESDNGALYENVKTQDETPEDILDEDKITESSDGNVIAYENMLYENVELKIVEPGDK